jgi:hypothetical protein
MHPTARSSVNPVLSILLLGLGPSLLAAAADDSFEILRHRALDDLFVLRDYRPGKASFVESPERHAGVWQGVGTRYTLLDLQGQGSIRHIWTTRGEGEPYFDWEVFVDGETTPSLRFTDESMVAAAAKVTVPVAPANVLPVHNRAFNLFLPIPFDRSLRLDVVQRQESFWLWFCQIDYRLEDGSLRGARLISEGTAAEPTFRYVGLPGQRVGEATPPRPTFQVEVPKRTLAPGQKALLTALEGPAIVRELRCAWSPEARLRLLIRFDGAAGYAVDAPMDRFFGPFEGVSFQAHGANDSSCYLPMPFRRNMEIVVVNEGDAEASVALAATAEPVPSFSPAWGWFHARHQGSDRTDGHRLHQVLYLRGRGHWLGMTLYQTGHDHGGGDFAVLDGEGDHPAFLHGVNGEDYFTFAWFGKGAHHPYAVAHTNDEGRYRHHFENVYPFEKSLALEWGAFADLSPESVAVWYQDSPEDTTLADGAREESVEWDVFGPVPIPHDAAGNATVPLFSVLPDVAVLDAGQGFECRLVEEHFNAGWMKEWSVGPMLNLTYLGRHGTKIGYEAELGGMGHAMLARRFLDSDQAQVVRCLFAHDDPCEVWVNGVRAYAGQQHFNGFESCWIDLPLRAGRNEVVVKLTNYFNRDFNWTGFLFRPLWE